MSIPLRYGTTAGEVFLKVVDANVSIPLRYGTTGILAKQSVNPKTPSVRVSIPLRYGTTGLT